MAIFNAQFLQSNQVASNIVAKLKAHLRALEDLNDLYAWTSGISSADLQAIGFSPSDASALLSAVADAHAEYLLHTTGLPPGTYPQPSSAYVYGASQNQVIGPN